MLKNNMHMHYRIIKSLAFRTHATSIMIFTIFLLSKSFKKYNNYEYSRYSLKSKSQYSNSAQYFDVKKCKLDCTTASPN